MAISKQTYGINKRILEKIGQNNDSNRITYVPHGIDTEMYYPINEESQLWDALTTQRNSLTDGNDDKFIVLWNNRNIHRKHPGDVVLAYKHFCQLVDKAGFNAQNDCMLVMHTNPMDPNGTDLFSVVNNLCNEYAVTFSDKVVSGDKLNILLNCSDVVVNMASNEGFGLATAEAMSAGIPVVVNVTGGLQDQCGFINPKTSKYFTPDDYIDIHTLHRKDLWGDLTHGEWVKPVWPSNISLQGSIPTPYIFDDRADYRDIGNALFEWFLVPKNKRKEFGMLGRQFILNSDASGMSKKDMSNRITSSINNCIDKFTKRERFDLFIA
jgi:glycosyltransferase involved in cell wall biosynthesis